MQLKMLAGVSSFRKSLYYIFSFNKTFSYLRNRTRDPSLEDAAFRFIGSPEYNHFVLSRLTLSKQFR